MKKILITGGAGFIGSYLANRLVDENYDIDIVDNQLRGDYSRLDSKVKIYNIDLTVAVYPWLNQIWHEDLDSKQVKLWEEWCNINQIKFVNFFPYFIKKT